MTRFTPSPVRALAVAALWLAVAVPSPVAVLSPISILAPEAIAAQELPRVSPAEAGFVPGRLERIGALLEDYVAGGSLPGAVVAVLRDGAVVYEEAVGYSDVDAGSGSRSTRSSASLRKRRRSSASP